MQPQCHMQVVVGLVDYGLNPQEALDRPRFCISDDTMNGQVSLEEGLPGETMATLQRMGHPVKPVSGYARAVFGRGHIIHRNPQTGILCGGSDPRSDGCAMTIL